MTTPSAGAGEPAILVVRRTIRAPRERVFAAWTEARHLTAWSRGAATEVIVTHERIADAATRAGHEQGWSGCLDGLARYAESRAGMLI